jgi:hypothetical protein
MSNSGAGGDAERWKEINLLAKAYLELQRSRVAFDLRVQKLEESQLVLEGLYIKIDKTEKDDETGKVIRRTTYKIIDSSDETKQKVKHFLKHLHETNHIYQILIAHRDRMHKQEKDMISDAADIFETSEVWAWCQRTKGLGPVAALTWMGYMNPAYTPTLANFWSKAGLTPGSKLKRGVQGHSSPIIKARIWMVTNNTIMARDPYYSRIYQLKKEYFASRPDLVDQSEGPNKIKGWKGKIHRYSLRFLMKILTSHAYEILMKEFYDGGGRLDPEVEKKLKPEQLRHVVYAKNYVPHRNLLPIKPEDEFDAQIALTSFEKKNMLLLEILRQKWDDEDDAENGHVKYYEFLRHAGDVVA